MSKVNGKGRKKRPCSAVQQEDSPDGPSSRGFGIAATLANLNQPIDNAMSPSASDDPRQSAFKDADVTVIVRKGDNESVDDGWTTVPSRKKRKISSDQSVAGGTSHHSYPAVTHSSNARLQSHVKIGDLQTLVLYLFGEGVAPQWVGVTQPKAIRKVVVLMVPGLEPNMFNGSQKPQPSVNSVINSDGHTSTTNDPSSVQSPRISPALPQLPELKSHSPDDYYPIKLDPCQLCDTLQPLADVFTHMWPIKSPGDGRTTQLYSDHDAMLTASIQRTQDEKDAVTSGPRPPAEAKIWEDKRTPITDYLATPSDLRDDMYTLHPITLRNEDEIHHETERRKMHSQTKDHGWIDSSVSSLEDHGVPKESTPPDSLTSGHEIIAIDCEMCRTAADTSALTRISAVSWDGSVLIDELVKPPSPVTDYLTPFSGITAEKLDPIKTTLTDIQQRLLPLLTPRTILVGHSLVSDLTALKLTHPFIIDTSFLYPHPRGPPYKSSLKFLAQKYLSRAIQTGHGSSGHDSIEDARAALDLVKAKCEKGPRWGTPEASRESLFKRLQRVSRPGSPLARLSGADVEWGSVGPAGSPRAVADAQIVCENDDQVVDGVRRAVLGDEDGLLVPGGGANVVFARMRALEAVRGWWAHDRNFDMEKLRLKARAKYTRARSDSPPLTSDLDAAAEHDSFATKFDDPLSNEAVDEVTRDTVSNIRAIHASLPPTTAFIVFSGALSTQRLQHYKQQYRQFKREYKTSKWDELSVKWGEEEEQAMKREFARVRGGVGFICMK